MGKQYYRKKGNKIIIEKKVDGKTIYIKTLPPAEMYLKTWRLDAIDDKASNRLVELREIVPNKFGQSILSEPKKEENKRRLTEEEKHLLFKMTK